MSTLRRVIPRCRAPPEECFPWVSRNIFSVNSPCPSFSIAMTRLGHPAPLMRWRYIWTNYNMTVLGFGRRYVEKGGGGGGCTWLDDEGGGIVASPLYPRPLRCLHLCHRHIKRQFSRRPIWVLTMTVWFVSFLWGGTSNPHPPLPRRQRRRVGRGRRPTSWRQPRSRKTRMTRIMTTATVIKTRRWSDSSPSKNLEGGEG